MSDVSPKTQALESNSLFEYTFNNDHTDNRVWIRVNEPYGNLNRQVDIGILVNGDGVSIDVYDAERADTDEFDDPILSPYVLWGDVGEEPE